MRNERKDDRVADPLVPKSYTGQIKANGLLERPTPQSRITLQILMGGLTHYRKSGVTDLNEVYAPGIGITDDNKCAIEKIHRGDVLFGFPGLFRDRMRRTGPVSLPEINVTSTVNGFDRSMRPQFMGVALFPGIGEGYDRTTDNVGTMAIAGVAAIMNNSPETFHPGDEIGMSLESFTVVGRDGKLMPGLDDIGQNPEKFRPRLFKINSSNILACLESIEIRVMDGLTRCMKDHSRTVSFRAIEKVCLDACDELNFKYDMSLQCAVFLTAARYLCYFMLRDEADHVNHPDVQTELQNFVEHSINNHWIDWCQRNRDGYDAMV